MMTDNMVNKGNNEWSDQLDNMGTDIDEQSGANAMTNEDKPDLSHLQKLIDKASAIKKLPEDIYIARVEDIDVVYHSENKVFVIWKMRVVSGVYANTEFKRQNTIGDSEKSFELFYRDLQNCGVTLTSYKNINKKWLSSKLVDKRVNVSVVYAGNSQPDYYIV